MNAKLIKACTVILLSSLFLFSCKKNSEGGKGSFHVKVYHGTTPIKGSTIYVSFGTDTKPTDPLKQFDLKISGETDDNHVHIEDLHYGTYYLYALGYDSLTKKQVEGGIAATIKWNARKEMTSVDLQTETLQ